MPNNNPYAQTYNAGWRNNPNFSWSQKNMTTHGQTIQATSIIPIILPIINPTFLITITILPIICPIFQIINKIFQPSSIIFLPESST